MAQSNKRYFNTFFFEDPYIEELDSETTLLYITMILNPHNNLAGCYEVTVRKLMNYTKLSENKVKLGIQKLVEDRKILFSGNWLALKNFIKNNNFNPNMCKSAFDIMKSAPADKVLFILSNHINGQLEPWVTDFIPKVESGINAKIDSQNRSLIKEAEKKGLPAPQPKRHQVFTVQSFMNELDSANNPTVREPFPQALPQPSAEQEYKPKFEYETEIETETEEERERNTTKYENINYEEPKETLESLFTKSVNYWNNNIALDGWVRCRYTGTMTIPTNKAVEIKKKFDLFTIDEIKEAIDNLVTCWNRINPQFRLSTYDGLMGKIESWTNEANPCERYPKVEIKRDYRTAEERRYFTQVLPMNADDKDWIEGKKQECIDSLNAIGEEFIDYAEC